MLKQGTEKILCTYVNKVPALVFAEKSLRICIKILTECFQNGGQLLICGNGGSCADADHIVGELVKSFRLNRPLEDTFSRALREQGEAGILLANRLQAGLPAVNLGAQSALMTAMLNDVGAEYIFAQQIVAYGRKGDVLLGISTSGNSVNIRNAGIVARAKRMKTIGLTGRDGGRIAEEFDLVLCADADSAEDIQDIHSIIYHAICAAVEYQFWGE